VFADKHNTIVWDNQKAKEVAKELGKECYAIKEVKLGYGVFFTKDGFFGGYGDSDELREEISSYLNFSADLVRRCENITRLCKYRNYKTCILFLCGDENESSLINGTFGKQYLEKQNTQFSPIFE